MAIPPTPELPPTRPGQAYQPTTAAAQPQFRHGLEKAWIWHPNPKLAEVVTISAEYAAILGVDAGKYIIPDLIGVCAVPGANNVRGEADWPMERLLSFGEGGGYYEVAKHLALQGIPLLNPMEPVPEKLLPPGVSAGGYLRATGCQSGNFIGRCHHSAWQWLEQQGMGEDARLVLHQPSFDAWRLWLVLSGKIPEVNPGAVERLRRGAAARLARMASRSLPDEQLKRVVAPRQEILDVAVSAIPAEKGMKAEKSTDGKPAKGARKSE